MSLACLQADVRPEPWAPDTGTVRSSGILFRAAAVPASSLEPLGREGRARELTRACKTPCRAVSRVIKPLNHQFSYCARENITIGPMWGWLWPSKATGENMSVRDQEQIFLFLKMNQSYKRNMQVLHAPGYTQTTELLVSSFQDVLSGTESLFLHVLHFYSSWDFPSHFFPLRAGEERSCCLIAWQSLSLFSSSFKLSLWFQQLPTSITCKTVNLVLSSEFHKQSQGTELDIAKSSSVLVQRNRCLAPERGHHLLTKVLP